MKKNKQEKNFYLALYLSIIAVALIAGTVTYSNLRSFDTKLQTAKKVDQKVLPVLSNKTKSYLTPEDRNEIPKEKIKVSEQKAKQKFFTAPETSPISTPQITNEIQNSPEMTNTEQSFNSFDENQKMAWPVFGEIVMNYDDENLVYDKTLEQYRTNECISLAAPVGEQVKASADGIVKLITKTDESGNTIVIDHGNDWSTIYSQLQDNLLVNEGDIVKKGQVIGGVNSPTKYGILLGSHLDFKITHEDNSVNPKLILANK